MQILLKAIMILKLKNDSHILINTQMTGKQWFNFWNF